MAKLGLFFFLLFWLVQQAAFGQSFAVEGVVFKHKSHEGLPFVSVGIKHSTRGTSSDAAGHFSIEAKVEDTLLFSAVGYRTLLAAAKDVKGPIYLHETSVALAPVTVTGRKKLRTASIGSLKDNTLVSMGGPNQYAMLLVPPPAVSSGELEEVSYMLQPDIRKNDRWKTAVRIRVYANDNGSPGRDLLPENLVVAVGKVAKNVTANVAAYAIVIPAEGIFIGLDFIGFFNEKGSFIPYSRHHPPLNLRIPFTKHQPSSQTFSRFFGTEWQAIQHRNNTGELLRVSAKFGAKVSY